MTISEIREEVIGKKIVNLEDMYDKQCNYRYFLITFSDKTSLKFGAESDDPYCGVDYNFNFQEKQDIDDKDDDRY